MQWRRRAAHGTGCLRAKVPIRVVHWPHLRCVCRAPPRLVDRLARPNWRGTECRSGSDSRQRPTSCQSGGASCLARGLCAGHHAASSPQRTCCNLSMLSGRSLSRTASLSLVRSQTDQDLTMTMLFGMLNCRAVTTASAAMKERVTFVMCALDALQRTTTCFTCPKPFPVCLACSR
jgi:hypothetical protein